MKAIGYDINKIDGIIGPNTIKESNKFCDAFWFFSNVNSIATLLSASKVHAEVSAIYPNWKEIVCKNLLHEWFQGKPDDFKREISWALQSNKSRYIVIVLNFYSFDKESPPQLPIPNNGILGKSFDDGLSPLRISTRDKEQNHFIKIVENGTSKEILKAFLRGGQTLEFDVPLGSYIIKYATGKKWYGERFLFGPYTAFGKADKVLEFKQIGYQVSGYSVELYLQPYGNLHTSKLSAFQF